MFTNKILEKSTDGAKSGNIINKVLTSDNNSVKKMVKTSFVHYQVYPGKVEKLGKISVSPYAKVTTGTAVTVVHENKLK